MIQNVFVDPKVEHNLLLTNCFRNGLCAPMKNLLTPNSIEMLKQFKAVLYFPHFNFLVFRSNKFSYKKVFDQTDILGNWKRAFSNMRQEE